MTKLFSVKSLAFAGAAAFALTLTAAPQADAAETTPGIAFEQRMSYKTEIISKTEFDKLTDEQKKAYSPLEGKKDKYIKTTEAGFVDAISARVAKVVVSQSAVNIVDGKLEYYYASAKTGAEAKKWVAVSTTDYRSEADKNIYFTVPVSEITKGKAADVYIAADAEGAKRTTKIACKAAPKIKASLTKVTSGASIEIAEKSTKMTAGTIEVKSQYGLFNAACNVADLAEGDEDLIETLQNAADFGGAAFTIAYISDDEMTASATAKLKVSATPKAPKVSLKIAKAFSLKFKDTNQYRTFAKDLEEEDVEKVKWNTGNGQALTMEGLFGKDNVTATAASATDFVLNNTMQLQAKTIDKKGKKMDSRIATTTIYKSAATPGAVNATVSNTVKKGKSITTDASIKFATTDLALSQAEAVSSGAVVTLQYYDTTSKKWKDVKNTEKAVTFKSGKIPDKVYVRVKGVDYKAAKGDTKASYYEAPGRILTITLDKDDPENKSTYDFDGTAVTKGAIKASK